MATRAELENELANIISENDELRIKISALQVQKTNLDSEYAEITNALPTMETNINGILGV